MKRTIQSALTYAESPGQDIVSILFSDNIIPRWCLELCLLREELSPYLAIINVDSSFELGVVYSKTIRSPDRGYVHWRKSGVKIEIGLTELDYWIHFFLQYYRDGVGDSNHIDVDIPPARSNTKKGLFLCLEVERRPLP
jgi:hypothetical protein